MVRHNSESSLVIDVKSNQHLDPLLMEFKDSVLIKNNKSFSYGKYGVLRYQRRLCVPDVDGLRDKIMMRLMDPHTPSIRGPQRCIMICMPSISGMKLKGKYLSIVTRCPN